MYGIMWKSTQDNTIVSSLSISQTSKETKNKTNSLGSQIEGKTAAFANQQFHLIHLSFKLMLRVPLVYCQGTM